VDEPITGVCHCGSCGFTLTERPEWLVVCNCTLCSRSGAIWGHVRIDSVSIREDRPARSYVQGDRLIAHHSCNTCACTTHWEELHPDQSNRMGVNFRMCSPDILKRFRIRHRDGADTGEFLD